MNIGQLEGMTLADLRALSKDYDIAGATRLKKEDLIIQIMQADAEKRGLELRGGVLEIMNEGMGFLRAEHYLPGRNDIYVSQSQIKLFGLKTGDTVEGVQGWRLLRLHQGIHDRLPRPWPRVRPVPILPRLGL